MRIIKEPIKAGELMKIAENQFGGLVKAVVDVESENGSKRENVWGINLYPEKSGDEWIEFDSMINIKPQYGNRSRGVDDLKIQEEIRKIVDKLILR